MAKNKIRFNIIDFVIIIALIGCIVGVALRYNVVDKIGLSSHSDNVEIEFVIFSIRPTSYDAMVKGDTFYWKQNNMEIGTLKEATGSYSEVFIPTSDLKMVKSFRDDRYDVRGVFSATGAMTESGFMLGGSQFLAPGKSLNVISKNIDVTLTITKITKVD